MCMSPRSQHQGLHATLASLCQLAKGYFFGACKSRPVLACQGLVMPPRVAPTQLVAIPITAAAMPADARAKLGATVADVMKGLKGAGVRAALDDRDNYRPGWKYNHWEVKVGPSLSPAGSTPLTGVSF